MSNSRRNFIKLSGLSAFALASPVGKLSSLLGNDYLTVKKSNQFGLQLFGIRDLMGKDPAATLKAVAAMGYKYVEPHEHQKLGMFYGMGNKGFKSFVNDLGMTIHSIHTNVYKDFEKNVALTSEIGIDYLIYNWEGPGKTMDDYKKMADDFNKKGEYCKQYGIKFAFHNHDFTFFKMGDAIPHEWLMQHTDPDLVDFQIDFYWVKYAGQDPVEWVNKYPTRFKLCHFKDRSKTSNEREKSGIVELGTGTIDFQNILDQIKKSSIKYYIVDQDSCNDREDPLQCSRVDADYMKQLKY